MSWLVGTSILVFFLRGLQLRARLKNLLKLDPSNEPVSVNHLFLQTNGVVMHESVKRAASAYARMNSLEVLDLIPGDGGYQDFLNLAAAKRQRPFAAESPAPDPTAGIALLVTSEILDPFRAEAAPFLEGRAKSKEKFSELATLLQWRARDRCGAALAPDLSWPSSKWSERIHTLRQSLSIFAFWTVITRLALFAFFVWLIVDSPGWGAAVLAAYQLRVVVAFAGLPNLNPQQLSLAALAGIIVEMWIWMRTITCILPEAPSEIDLDCLRREYQDQVSLGTDVFFDPKIENCPLCRDSHLGTLLSFRDYFQHKPGVFVLVQCRACGHIFQNPRLSERGLRYYYKDFYDGLGEKVSNAVFTLEQSSCKRRAKVLHGLCDPNQWLDVGGGHGHFCRIGKSEWPRTRFDLLDMSEQATRAERVEWCDKAWHGTFRDQASELIGRYDVVSMFHYLEHTTDPEQELLAAKQVLRPGGYLIIELPDPECLFRHLLKTWWFPYFQPQHLHLLSRDNLVKLLQDQNFRVVSFPPQDAYCNNWDLLYLMCLSRLIGPPDRPWSPGVEGWRRYSASLLWQLLWPGFMITTLAGLLTAPLKKPLKLSNHFSIVARKVDDNRRTEDRRGS